MADQPKIFLSYASQDRDRVSRYFDKLKALGFDVWMDSASLKGGQNWDLEIKKALRAADAVVFFLSETSVEKRGYVQRELKAALDFSLEKLADDVFLIPVRIDSAAAIPKEISHIHVIDSVGIDDPSLLDALTSKFSPDQLPTRIDSRQSSVTYSFQNVSEAWEGLPGYDICFDIPILRSEKYPQLHEVQSVISGWLYSNAQRERAVKYSQIAECFNFGQEADLRTNTWEARCDAVCLTGSTISLVYTIYWYGAGAAHPNHHFRTFNFGLNPLISIESFRQLFNQEDLDFKFLQDLVRDEIKKSY